MNRTGNRSDRVLRFTTAVAAVAAGMSLGIAPSAEASYLTGSTGIGAPRQQFLNHGTVICRKETATAYVNPIPMRTIRVWHKPPILRHSGRRRHASL
jgi:hypothetical protein